MTVRPVKALALLSALALAASLTACGKTGSLEQPAPLFGAKAKADYDARHQNDAEAQAAKRADPQPSAADPTDRPLSEAPYAQPIPGRTSPFGQPPAGALPDPGTPSAQ